MEPLELQCAFFSDSTSAEQALKSVGGMLMPELTFDVQARGIGNLRRHFALLGNLVTQEVEDDVLWQRLQPLLDSQENEVLVNRLKENRLNYMPVSKRAVTRLVDSLHARRLHLPWAFKPMNYDFASKVSGDLVRFKAFYSQLIDVRPAQNAIHFRRIFSLPLQGMVQGTFQEPIYDELLDEDVGLFLEANVLLAE